MHATDDRSQEIKILDISNHSAPSSVGGYDFPGRRTVLSLAAFGSALLVGTKNAASDGELHLLDVSVPASPLDQGSLEIGGDVVDITLQADIDGTSVQLATSNPTQELVTLRFDASFATQSADAFVKDALARGLDVKWLLTGDDFRFGARRSGDVDLLRRLAPELGMEVESMHTVEVDGVRASSTAVREALAGGLLERAQRLLGRPYAITGRVVGGDRIGRELGFPTANIRMSLNRPPLWGIYAVTVRGLGTAPKIGAASLGVRPTVNSSGKATLEVFLLDFDGDIYGRRVRVEFLHKLRDEEKYPTLEALRNQIGLDVSATREFFRLRPPARAAV